MTKDEFRELASYHHGQGIDLARAVETTDGRPSVKQGMAAKAAWHLRMSTSLTAAANAIEPTTKSTIHHASV